MDRGAWPATAHGVTKRQTYLVMKVTWDHYHQKTFGQNETLGVVLLERDVENIYCSGEKNGVKREARVKLSGQDGHLEHIDLSPQPANIKEFNKHIQDIPHEDTSCGKN